MAQQAAMIAAVVRFLLAGDGEILAQQSQADQYEDAGARLIWPSPIIARILDSNASMLRD